MEKVPTLNGKGQRHGFMIYIRWMQHFGEVFVSTKRLLHLASLSRALHADATYKLVWEGFPVLIVGVSDKNKIFHPVGMALTYGETEKDFSFMFQLLKENTDHHPSILIADCSEAITNAFRSAFGDDFTRVFCSFHVLKNVDKFLKPSKFAGIRSDIRNDISFMQLCSSEEEFEAWKKLWIKKWEKNETAAEFVTYFAEEYLHQRNGWYEGRAPGFHSTNNGLEATNNWVKKEATFRIRLPIAQFMQRMQSTVEGWSLQREPSSINCKVFNLKPVYTLDLQTKAYNWCNQNLQLKRRTLCASTKVLYFVPAAGTKPLKEAEINSFLRLTTQLTWKSFDTYRACLIRLWLIEFNPSNWELSTCNCPRFKKEYICKHAMGIAIINKLYNVQAEAKAIPLGEKRKRGRPTGVKKALLVE